MTKLTELPNLDGWNVNLLLAIMWQESKFELDAKRFEPHVFERYSKAKGVKTFKRAFDTNAGAAFLATSWGVGQVMGFNISSTSPKKERVKNYISDLRNPEKQIKLMLDFIKKQPKKFIDMFQNRADIDFAYIAKIYNGTGYKKNNYDVLIKEHYEKYCVNETALCSFISNVKLYGKIYPTNVYDPGILKMQEELGVEVDGYFGKKTLEALNKHNSLAAELQSKVQDEIDREEIEKLKQPLTEEQRTKDWNGGEIINVAKPVFDGSNDFLLAMSDEPEQTARVLQEVNQEILLGKFLKWLRF